MKLAANRVASFHKREVIITRTAKGDGPTGVLTTLVAFGSGTNSAEAGRT